MKILHSLFSMPMVQPIVSVIVVDRIANRLVYVWSGMNINSFLYLIVFYSYYPWFEVFYNILNDLSQIINSKSVSSIQLWFYIQSLVLFKETDVEQFLTSLYNYKLMPIEEFYRKSGQELIEISSHYSYSRPDQRILPSIISNVCCFFALFKTEFIHCLAQFYSDVFSIKFRCNFTFIR